MRWWNPVQWRKQVREAFRKKSRNRPMFPRVYPAVEVLEKRWLMSFTLQTLNPPLAIEGASTGNQTLGSFTFDTGVIGDYGATINWGDSNSTPATLVPGNGNSGSIVGSHTYAEEG